MKTPGYLNLMKKVKPMKLTNFELDVMQIVWQSDRDLSTREIYDEIAKKRQVVYNTVKTIIDRLEEKGALERTDRKAGRALVFRAAVTRKSLSEHWVPEYIERFFCGSPSALFSHLLSGKQISDQELSKIKELLEEYEQTPK